ncbi:hypothetical protein RB195_017734 [Necator americanus]|uniref:P-type domain-containing protein n=1 Tax=Necator americanus TaxID=51031 RepID=A0ABR1C8M3_NECAM
MIGMRPTLVCFLLFTVVWADDVRMDCHPEPSANKEKCEARDCIWQESKDSIPGIPWCYMKKGIGYKYVSIKDSVTKLRKNNGPRNPWGPDIPEIFFKASTIGKTLNVMLYAPERYEPPLDLPRRLSVSDETLRLNTVSDGNMFSFKVIRKSTGTTLFDTSLGGLIFSDKFLQIASYLPSDIMYGWGENVHPTLKHNFTRYTTWAMFARDEWPNSDRLDTKNLYGVHPFYMMLERDGKAHGVFILNSNAQEVTTTPGPALIYRTIGGNLDLYFFPGPTPEEVTQQYLALIGTPFLPAYWALGFQISRYGYKDLDEMIEKIERNVKAGIPLDTSVADIDYMDRYKDFTVGEKWSKLGSYVEDLHSRGMRTILMFDPAIQVDYDTFNRGMDAKANFIEWEREDQVMRSIQDRYPLVSNTKIMLGVVWPDRHVAFPDFLDPTNNTAKWWIEEFVRFHKLVPFDGIWIDMNEPANFGTNIEKPWYFDNPDHPNIEPLKCPMKDGGKDAEWDMPPYKTHSVWVFGQDAYLASQTLCMLAVQAGGTQRHYNVKSLYGFFEAKTTQQAQYKATNKRGLVVSRSTFASTGRYAGHWLGDNSATWEDLQSAVIGAQEFNLFGIPYIGSDICGFNRETNEELCLRWHQMGAFHTFMRNHNAINQAPQDPAQWSSVAAAAKKANLFRYKYLPYVFSLLFVASLNGGTVIRPVFYEYPQDSRTHDLGYQFLWGSSMMIAPVVHQGETKVQAYLPEDDWYSMYDHEYGHIVRHGHQTFPAPWTSLIPVFVRGGSILPRQKPNVTTEYTRKNAFELLIAPGNNFRPQDSADGLLYWDDGDSIVESFSTHNYYHWEFKYTSTEKSASLLINTRRKAELRIPYLDTLEIFNYRHNPDFDSFSLNGEKVKIDTESSNYNIDSKILYISTKNLIDMATGKPVELTWKHSVCSGSVERGFVSLLLLSCVTFAAWIL